MNAQNLDALRQKFDEKGFLILPGALMPQEVRVINEALDRDLKSNDWPLKRGDGHLQDANILLRVPELDLTVENPRLMPILRTLIEDVTFDEFSAMFRNPTQVIPEKPAWHRDFKRNETYPLGIHALSLVYYLSDVSNTDHCFAMVEGTHNRWRDVKPGEHDRAREVDLLGPAGTAAFFHTALVHTARLRLGSRQRRTLHLYYGHADTPQISNYTDIPDRLRSKTDPFLPPKFYSKRRAGAK
ncbi:MAG: phytanoyl-CoA dioxygenase family protein [Planctomycetes bacterium]|nr:phytanoyl-CoA dioxygenase family protein [Planctomycetota bacterium]